MHRLPPNQPRWIETKNALIWADEIYVEMLLKHAPSARAAVMTTTKSQQLRHDSQKVAQLLSKNSSRQPRACHLSCDSLRGSRIA